MQAAWPSIWAQAGGVGLHLKGNAEQLNEPMTRSGSGLSVSSGPAVSRAPALRPAVAALFAGAAPGPGLGLFLSFPWELWRSVEPSLGGSNKEPETGGLINSRHSFLTAQRAGRPRSGANG